MFAVATGIGSAGLPLYTKEQLQQSASAKDGLDPHKELQWRRQYTHFITDVGKNLGAPQWAIYTAIFLCHHYFVKRSMLRNDRYLIATACLYLACKVQESPKYLRDVIKQAEIKKWSKWQKEHPLEPKKWEDITHLEAMRDQVLVAERAVLYTISFQLRVKVPYPDVLSLQQYVDEKYKHDIVNLAWNLVNDSLNTLLSLVYPPEKLAAACLYLAHQMHGVPLPSKDGRGFCQLANITYEEVQDICDQVLDVYITVVAAHKAMKVNTPARPTEQQLSAQPSSPDADSHLQLQENRVRLVPPLTQQQRRGQQQQVVQGQQQQLAQGQQQQQQQQERQYQQPSSQSNGGHLQHAGPS